MALPITYKSIAMRYQVVLPLPHIFFFFAPQHPPSFLLSGRFEFICDMVIISDLLTTTTWFFTIIRDMVIRHILIIMEMVTTTTIYRPDIMRPRSLLHLFSSRLFLPSFCLFPHFPFFPLIMNRSRSIMINILFIKLKNKNSNLLTCHPCSDVRSFTGGQVQFSGCGGSDGQRRIPSARTDQRLKLQMSRGLSSVSYTFLLLLRES